MNMTTIFVSQKEFKDRRLQRIGCGVAATMMLLLKHHMHKSLVPSEKDLSTCLWCLVSPVLTGYEEDDGFGVSIEDVLFFLNRSSIPYRDTYFDKSFVERHEKNALLTLPKWLENAPIMVGVDGAFNSWQHGHWIVLVAADDHGYSYLDPRYKSDDGRNSAHISYGQFIESWGGYSIQLQGLNKRKRTWPPIC